jgi:hypothetical protein
MRLILFLASLLVGSSAFAQEVRPVECRFLAFGSKDEVTAIALSDKGEDISCPLPTSQLSKKIACTAKDGKISFISAADRKPMATASIPSGVNSALVVFVRQEKAEPATGWRAFVIEDSAKSFPDGGAYVANFYSNDIRFTIGGHKGTLKPAGAHGYAMPKERDDFNMAPVIFEFNNGGKWRIANESSLRFLPGMRYLIFAYVDPVSGRPKINTYQDMAGPPKEANP